jgi:hypothetical protein
MASRFRKPLFKRKKAQALVAASGGNFDGCKDRPKDGDEVAHCGHLGKGMVWTRVNVEGGFEVIGKDPNTGVIVRPAWMLECEDCYLTRDGSEKFLIKGHGKWRSD